MKKKKKGARKAAGRGGQGRQNFSTSGASIVSAASSSGRRTRTRTTNSTSDGTSNGRSALANTSSSSGAAAAGGAGYAAYAHMTARGQTKTPLGLKLQDCGERGVRVYKVVAGSLADTGGLRTSDLLVRVNNRPTRSLAEFRKVVSSSIQSTLLVKVERRGVGAIECRLKR